MEKNENESWYVYILMCSNRNIYTGITNNLQDRLKRHNSGKVKSTSRILPVELITCVVFNNKYRAYKFEKYLKSGSGRAFAKRHLY